MGQTKAYFLVEPPNISSSFLYLFLFIYFFKFRNHWEEILRRVKKCFALIVFFLKKNSPKKPNQKKKKKHKILRHGKNS